MARRLARILQIDENARVIAASAVSDGDGIEVGYGSDPVVGSDGTGYFVAWRTDGARRHAREHGLDRACGIAPRRERFGGRRDRWDRHDEVDRRELGGQVRQLDPFDRIAAALLLGGVAEDSERVRHHELRPRSAVARRAHGDSDFADLLAATLDRLAMRSLEVGPQRRKIRPVGGHLERSAISTVATWYAVVSGPMAPEANRVLARVRPHGGGSGRQAGGVGP